VRNVVVMPGSMAGGTDSSTRSRSGPTVL
jgi:hypothetical protein